MGQKKQAEMEVRGSIQILLIVLEFGAEFCLLLGATLLLSYCSAALETSNAGSRGKPIEMEEC